MRRNIRQCLIVATTTLSFAACDVKDPIYNTPHPEQGAVTLTTDWSGIGEGLAAPGTYTVAVGGYSAMLSGTANLLDHLFEPGKYSIYAYNTPEHIIVTGTTATVTTASGNVYGAGQFVQEMPGWFFTGKSDAEVEKDTDHEFMVSMVQQVRQLTLIIEPTGGTVDKIEGIDGCLSGAAGTLDIDNGTHAAPMNAELQFSEITEGTNAGKWSATVRLLGIAGPQQKLDATIRFVGGNPGSLPLESDLTTVLAAFNADKRTPLMLGGEIVETPTGAGFEASISDWMPGSGDGEDIEAKP